MRINSSAWVGQAGFVGSRHGYSTSRPDHPCRPRPAIATAEKEAGGAALKIDDENVDREWEVDVLVGDKVVEVKVSPDGTEVLGQEDDGDVDDGEKAEPGQLVEAIKAALAHTPGTLDDAELDEDDGALYWKVELDQTGSGDDVELRVDPGTLEVTPDR